MIRLKLDSTVSSHRDDETDYMVSVMGRSIDRVTTMSWKERDVTCEIAFQEQLATDVLQRPIFVDLLD